MYVKTGLYIQEVETKRQEYFKVIINFIQQTCYPNINIRFLVQELASTFLQTEFSEKFTSTNRVFFKLKLKFSIL